MRRIFLLLSVVIIALFLNLTNTHQVSAQIPPFPVSQEVPNAPVPVKANGKIHLFYELHITNFRAKSLTLLRVEVINGDSKAQLIDNFQGSKLTSRLSRPGTSANLTNNRIIGGGLRAIMFVQLTFDTPADVPRTFRHRLFFKPDDNATANGENVVEGTRVSVKRSAPLVIGPPLRGDGWVVANSASNISGHRRAVIVLDGKARIPQRFATDWIKLGSDGKLFHDNPAKNANWYGYGAEVLAVAKATVVAVKGDIPENEVTAAQKAVPITLETAAGNHIILSLGGGYFAVYGHLQPGSLRVKVGDTVRRGQVLASLGNTGNSDAPHLHFHIADTNSPLDAEGLPFVFDTFEVQGAVSSMNALLSSEAWRPELDFKPDRHRMEIPVENAVVRFP
jgi:murein DD-endopeptidase MepM/ murein hydrolase activator NlpD